MPLSDGSRVVRLRRQRVRFRVAGDGEPLLLLNGLTRPLESWETFERALGGDRMTITLDAPGVGGSRTPVLPLPIPMVATLAAAVLDEVGVAAADVLGFSYGGTVAQQMAAQSPERVSRLVLVATSCGVGATPGNSGALTASMAPPDNQNWPRPHAVGTLWQYLAISNWSSIPFLGSIAVPTLVVCGTRDRVVPPSNSALLARRIPGARLVRLTAGHDLQRGTQAAALARVVEPFLLAGTPASARRAVVGL